MPKREFESGLVLKPIGFIRSCYKDRFGTPRQSDLVKSAEAWIEFEPDVQPEFSLAGLKGFSHIWVIFHFHKNTNVKFSAKVHPPRLEGESVGVYATRSPHRPNSLGLSLVELLQVELKRVKIGGHDLIEGTPVLDIKPYLKESESKPNAKSGWGEAAPYKANLKVEWRPKAIEFVGQNVPEPDRFRALVEDTLSLDPRPLVYKIEKPLLREKHAVRFLDWDVFFEFPEVGTVVIVEVLPWPH
jgi:tRNA (adenine37-N6)-methyltransferase